MVGVWPGQDGVGGLEAVGGMGGGGEEDVGMGKRELCGVVQVCLSRRRVGEVGDEVVRGGCNEVGWLESGVDVGLPPGCRQLR